MIDGQATPVGTQRFFLRHPGMQPRSLGKTGWSSSTVGFGTYRVQDQDPHHPEALRCALLSGCNIIDTSTNYGDGKAESLIGKTLHSLIQEKKIFRDEIILVTKAGYIQESQLLLARQKKQMGTLFSDVTEWTADCWHCISPDFLENQITQSLERLQVKTIDVLLLHNPEYFLKTTPHPDEYYSRIEKAFRYLEAECDRGKIQYYGVSSNTFIAPQNSPSFTSLAAIWDLAQEIGPQHRFRVVQFPFNLLESDAAWEPNGPHYKTLLEQCIDTGLATLTNRPLNAFLGHDLIRLALCSPPKNQSYSDLDQEFVRSCTQVIDLEHDLQIDEETPFGDWLRENANHFKSLHTWRNFLEHRLLPAIAAADLPRNYQEAVLVMLRNFGARFEWKENQKAKEISQRLEELAPHIQKGTPLSRQVLQIYQSIPGIDCVLVGMRHEKYVQDLLPPPPVIPSQEALEVLSADWREWISQRSTD